MATQFGDTTVSSFTASLVNMVSGTAANLAITNAFTFQKVGQQPVLNLDQNGLTSSTSTMTNVSMGNATATNARISALSANNVFMQTGIVTLNPGFGTSVTASLGNVQAGVVNVINPGLADTQDFNITVESAKISSVSSVINASFQLTNHDFNSSGITLKNRITSIETGKFSYGIYVSDQLGSSFSDNFALHFTIINASGS